MPLAAVDVASLTSALGICTTDLTLLGSKLPHATYQSLARDGCQVVCVHSQFCLRIRLSVPAGWHLLGYVHQAGRGSWCRAVPLHDDCAFIVQPGLDVDLMLRPGGRMTVIVYPADRVDDHREKGPNLVGPSSAPARLFRPAEGGARAALSDSYEALWSPHLCENANWHIATAVQQHLDAALAARSADILRCSRGRMRQYIIFCRGTQFMEAHLHEDVYLHAIAVAVGASERSLRYTFQDLAGVSPMRYLKLLRLSHACRTLAASDASRRSVKSVAINCGLHDLSRFALAYRRAFGELPYDTLLRSPPPATWGTC